MLETDLQKKCLEWCKQNNIVAYNQHENGFTGKGVPDILLCINGKFVACELKVGKGGLSPAQKIRKKQIERAGGLHFVPRSLNQFIEIIMGVKNNDKS